MIKPIDYEGVKAQRQNEETKKEAVVQVEAEKNEEKQEQTELPAEGGKRTPNPGLRNRRAARDAGQGGGKEPPQPPVSAGPDSGGGMGSSEKPPEGPSAPPSPPEDETPKPGESESSSHAGGGDTYEKESVSKSKGSWGKLRDAFLGGTLLGLGIDELIEKAVEMGFSYAEARRVANFFGGRKKKAEETPEEYMKAILDKLERMEEEQKRQYQSGTTRVGVSGAEAAGAASAGAAAAAGAEQTRREGQYVWEAGKRIRIEEITEEMIRNGNWRLINTILEQYASKVEQGLDTGNWISKKNLALARRDDLAEEAKNYIHLQLKPGTAAKYERVINDDVLAAQGGNIRDKDPIDNFLEEMDELKVVPQPGGKLDGLVETWIEGVKRNARLQAKYAERDQRVDLGLPVSQKLANEISRLEGVKQILNWGIISTDTLQKMEKLAERHINWLETAGPDAVRLSASRASMDVARAQAEAAGGRPRQNGGRGETNPVTEDRLERGREFRENFFKINERLGKEVYEKIPSRGSGAEIYQGLSESEADLLEARLLIYNARARIQNGLSAEDAGMVPELMGITKAQLQKISGYKRVSEAAVLYTAIVSRPDLMVGRVRSMGLPEQKFLKCKDEGEILVYRQRVTEYLMWRFGLSKKDAEESEVIGYNLYRSFRVAESVNNKFNTQYNRVWKDAQGKTENEITLMGMLAGFGTRNIMNPGAAIYGSEPGKLVPRNLLGQLMLQIREASGGRMPFWQTKPMVESVLSSLKFNNEVLLKSDGFSNISEDALLVKVARELIDNRNNEFKFDWGVIHGETPLFSQEFSKIKWAQYVYKALEDPSKAKLEDLERAFVDLGTVETSTRQTIVRAVVSVMEKLPLQRKGSVIALGGSFGRKAALQIILKRNYPDLGVSI